MEHSSEKFRTLWLEVSQHVSANDHELEEKAAFLQQQEQKFINVIEASRKLESFILESPDKYCIPLEQRERDEVVPDISNSCIVCVEILVATFHI